MSKNSKVTDFIRRNSYYLAFVLCLAVLAVITVALVMTGSTDNSLQTGGGNQIEDVGGSNNGNNQEPDDDVNKTPSDDENQNQPSVDEKPTVSVIVFDMPVQGASIIKDYVGASVVYNQTLGLYTGHKAIDFAAEEGTVVSCVYDGVVESIEISKVNGTTVTVDHGNGLKSVYNSIEAVESLQEGATVLKGDALGTVSTNNKTEHLDGAHLHFEVWENGEKIDPTKYLTIEGK
jgi:murein DD-endopeptidase MepM/ murein hydrolase activator NlpD